MRNVTNTDRDGSCVEATGPAPYSFDHSLLPEEVPHGSFRGAFKNQKGEVVAAVATFRGMLEEVDPGNWKAGDKAETKFNAALSYYKLEVDGQVVYELDPANCIRIINGKDEAAEERKAIGM